DLDGERFQGRSKLLDYVREHPDTLEKLAVSLENKDMSTADAVEDTDDGE
ncbi:hypothetical protein LCGC14_2243940, partial [marine sediment metagenome]